MLLLNFHIYYRSLFIIYFYFFIEWLSHLGKILFLNIPNLLKYIMRICKYYINEKNNQKNKP